MVYRMLNRIKKLSLLKGKKRYLVMGWLGLELLTLPAAAHQIVNNVSFEVRPMVTAVEIPTNEPGVSRFLVASNAGFGVKANDVVGDIQIDVHVSGTLHKSARFGDAAQLPGPKTSCAQAAELGSNIYLADRKTAAVAGTPPEQAVIFEFNYDAGARPSFVFTPGVENSSTIQTCQGTTT